ncbi:unnamed protein product [Durusdinium trenchii]|uniref:Uncharacterized protein n=2 Tax=Durusdinium trenchii TaxID=1381693 RepID=A0ABP0K8K9_9DINO
MLSTPPKKRLYDMTCDELRSTCKKMGRKQAGTKAGRFETCCEAGVGHGGPTISKKGKAQWAELQARLKDPNNLNGRGWAWRHGMMAGGPRTYVASGEHRKVYKQAYTKGPRKGQWAASKEFKTGSVFEEKFFANDIHAAKKAADILKSFNQYTAGISEPIPLVHMNMPEVWTQVDGTEKYLIEPFIKGAYEKFNSNSGWANMSHPLMQALSHYSWHSTEGAYLVCDLQGHFDGESYLLTDPVVLSKKEEFGVTDGGQMMIENFFGHHVCGRYCNPRWGKPASALPRMQPRSGTSFFHHRL